MGVVTIHYVRAFDPFLLERGYLAVDLFFMMSGIVIAHAYDGRLSAGMTAGQFLRLRIARLYPLYFLGLAIAALPLLVAIALGLARSQWTWASYGQALIFGVLMLPNPGAPGSLLYPMNAPAWSLFWELLVNFAYAATFPWISRPVLLIIILLSGVVLAASGLAQGSVDFGYEWASLHIALARVVFSFSVGVLISRLHDSGQLPVIAAPTLALILLVAGLLAIPAKWGVTPDILAICLIFPLICIVAVGVESAGFGFCTFLGVISYPLYAVHMPMVNPLYLPLQKVMGQPIYTLAPWAGFAMLAFLALFAWGLARWYDPWARRILSSILLGRPAILAPQS